MRTIGVKTVIINYTLSGGLGFGSYILEFPEASLTHAQINCSVAENGYITFWETLTTQTQLTRAQLLFAYDTARNGVRTNHYVEIIGTWK